MTAQVLALPRPSGLDQMRRIVATFEGELEALRADPAAVNRAARIALYENTITRYRARLAREDR